MFETKVEEKINDIINKAENNFEDVNQTSLNEENDFSKQENNVHTEHQDIKNQIDTDQSVKKQNIMDRDEAESISVKEIDLIREAIEQNWNMLGLDQSNGFVAVLHVSLNEKGELKKLQIEDVQCPFEPSVCKSMMTSIRRAVKLSVPFNFLMPSRFEVWKEFKLEFKPE